MAARSSEATALARRAHVSGEQEKPVTIVGLQPEEGSSIPGIRRWPAEYMPGIFNASLVDRVAAIYMKTDGDIREMLRVILTSDEFYAPEAYRGKI